jgi:hypothetical protein
MNDTEDAVRRLFTATTQDIPPGIDLGHDVRARSRTRVVRARVVLSASLAAIGAAATVITIIGEFDPARSLGEETVDGGTQIRYVGSYIYIPVFGAFRRTHPK